MSGDCSKVARASCPWPCISPSNMGETAHALRRTPSLRSPPISRCAHKSALAVEPGRTLFFSDAPNCLRRFSPVGRRGFAAADPRDTEVWTRCRRWSPCRPFAGVPSDAVVLFDGANLAEWEAENGGAPGGRWPMAWSRSGPAPAAFARNANLPTASSISNGAARPRPTGEGQGRGNSGVYLQGRYEVQILDSFHNPNLRQTVRPLRSTSRPRRW